MILPMECIKQITAASSVCSRSQHQVIFILMRAFYAHPPRALNANSDKARAHPALPAMRAFAPGRPRAVRWVPDGLSPLFPCCRDLKEAIKCIHSYTRLCMKLNHRRHFKKLFHGTGMMVHELCNNGTYQDGKSRLVIFQECRGGWGKQVKQEKHF